MMQNIYDMNNYLVAGLLIINLLTFLNAPGFAQAPSAILDLSSTKEGFLMPRMTTDQRDSIETPTEGMMIYDRTTQSPNYYDGDSSTWIDLGPTGVKRDIIAYFAGLPGGVQLLLEAGETPLNLLKHGVDPDQIIGNTYAGGYIFYLFLDGSGLVVAPEDQSNALDWGCDGIPVDGADGTSVGTGRQNSLDIESACTGNHAARTCLNLSYSGYSDWYLPSRDELNHIWLELVDSDGMV